MNALSIKGVIRKGRVEVAEPIDLPDGTEVVVTSSSAALDDADEDWDNTPEGIADWLNWYRSLEPLIFTSEEEADTQACLTKMNEYSSVSTDDGIDDLFR